MKSIVNFSLKRPGIVFIALIILFSAGAYEYKTMPVDAFPDISPVMVPIFCESHGMAPEEMERLITWPIESAMNGLPGVLHTKSTSAFGLSVVYVYFSDDTDIYFARQIVSERLLTAGADLPRLETPPTLGPISTGLGQIFNYYLAADADKVDTQGKDLNTWLRELNDWVIKYQLQTVKGVSAVLSMGGHVLQYQVQINPQMLTGYQISLEEVVDAINSNNRNAGGQFLVLGAEEHLVRGIGLLKTITDLENLPVKVINSTPVFLKDIATVRFGNEIRRGAVTRNGHEEVVSGIVMKLFAENTSQVISRLHEKMTEIRKSLPQGVRLVPYYDQAELVTNATSTVVNALLQGSALIFLILILFMGNWRPVILVVISLPVCAFTALLLMGFWNISANLMSLGGIAIAIGMLCDGSIVVVESILRQQALAGDKSRYEIFKTAVMDVGKPVIAAGFIVITVFLPLATLEGVEGKMFSPMAFSISSAMLGSIVAALFFIPGLGIIFLSSKPPEETALVKWLQNRYNSLLNWALQRRKQVVTVAVIVFFASLGVLSTLGTEFVPVLEEGSIFISVAMAPSIALERATELIMSLEKQILDFNEVEEVVSRIGRPEAGSHPHPVNYGEIHINLKPQKQWRKGITKENFIEELNKKLGNTPGVHLNFTQPIQNAFDELLSGVKSQLAIKVYGEDLTVLQNIAEKISHSIENVRGLSDLAVEQSFGQPQIQIIADREKCARHSIAIDHILHMVELAIGGENISTMFINNRRFSINLRYQEQWRQDPEQLKNMLLPANDGSLIPLSELARIESVIGPMQINRENNQRRWTVQGNFRGRDMGSTVEEIRKVIDEKIDIPAGYSIEYGGQFENQQRAMRRLSIIVPAAITGVFLVLWLMFASLKHAMIIFTMVPLSVIGGIFGLTIMQQHLSVPASIGFIALFGMAMLDGLVMISCFNQLKKSKLPLKQVVIEGSLSRLAPVMVTTITTLLGLLPLLLASGPGSEIQRPLAAVVVFGLFTSTFLTLIVIPSIYLLAEE